MLARDESRIGSLVKSLHIKPAIRVTDEASHRAVCLQLLKSSNFILSDGEEQKFEIFQVMESFIQEFYNKVDSLETLIIEDLAFSFEFRSRSNIELAIQPFLVNSLKKLYISPLGAHMSHQVLSAINCLWLLIFCPHLEEAALLLEFRIENYLFLERLDGSMRGLSKIKKLALRFWFAFDTKNDNTCWQNTGDSSGMMHSKVKSVYHLIGTTSRLLSLELTNLDRAGQLPSERINSSCLSNLDKSWASLRHLRLFGFDTGFPYYETSKLASFKVLRVLSIDIEPLIGFSADPSSAPLPSSIEILSVPYYLMLAAYPVEFTEETLLIKILQSNTCACLKEVILPSKEIGEDGRLGKPSEVSHHRAKKAKELKNLKIFRDGKVKLRRVEPGEQSE